MVQTTFMGFALAGIYLLFSRHLRILVAAHHPATRDRRYGLGADARFRLLLVFNFYFPNAAVRVMSLEALSALAGRAVHPAVKAGQMNQ